MCGNYGFSLAIEKCVFGGPRSNLLKNYCGSVQCISCVYWAIVVLGRFRIDGYVPMRRRAFPADGNDG